MIIEIIFVGSVLFFVIFYFNTKPDVNTNLQIVKENKSHPWIHRQRDYNPPGDSPLG